MPLTGSISENSTKTPDYKTISAKFGEGFGQRAADGLNAKKDTWSLQWVPVTLTNRNTIVAALDAVGGWDYLTWTPPGEGSSKKYIVVGGYTENYIADRYRISCKLEQVFDV
jgi:phage-related protein